MNNSYVKRLLSDFEVVWSDEMKERFSVLDYHVGRKAIQYLLERFIIEMQEDGQEDINNTVLKALQSLETIVIKMQEDNNNVMRVIEALNDRITELELSK
jgi:predicted DNA-binding protein